jgi:hypothetical protein
MIRRTSMTLVLAGSAFLLAGCNRAKEEGAAPAVTPEAAPVVQTQQVTLYVEGMTGRQGIT